MTERQPQQTLAKANGLTTSLSILLIGCLSFSLICISPVFAITHAEMNAQLKAKADAKNVIHAGSLITNTYQGEANRTGIQLSKQCLNSLQNNVQTSCPSYDQLFSVDNTNHKLYGKFVQDEKGFWHRGKAQIPNYYNVVKPKEWVVAVDPTEQFIEGKGTKMILIVPNSFTYINPDQSVGNNHTRIEYHDRYVDTACNTATIAYSDLLLKDTISYLESGCKTTSYVDHVIKPTGNSPFDMEHSIALKQQNYKNQAKKITGNCITQACDMPVNTLRKW